MDSISDSDSEDAGSIPAGTTTKIKLVRNDGLFYFDCEFFLNRLALFGKGESIADVLKQKGSSSKANSHSSKFPIGNFTESARFDAQICS
jgi:hypothetical protein